MENSGVNNGVVNGGNNGVNNGENNGENNGVWQTVIADIGQPRRLNEKKEFDVYIADQNITTTVTKVSSAANEWLNNVYAEFHAENEGGTLIVGFDARKASGGERYCTLQFCVGRRCLLYQILLSNPISDGLRDFCASTRNVFVGLGTDNKLDRISTDYNMPIVNFIEAEYLAPDLENERINSTSLRNTRVRDLILPDGDKLDENWDTEGELTPMQVLSATIGAFVSYQIAVSRDALAAF